MGLKDFLQSRRDDAELGRGLWRRAQTGLFAVLIVFIRFLNALPIPR